MFNLERVHFNINTEFYNIDFKLFHNINILVGKSGSNKSNLAVTINNIITTIGDLFTKGYNANREIVEYRTRVILFGSAVELEMYGNGNYFIIIDDVRIEYMDTVLRMIKENSNIVFLLIDRSSERSVGTKEYGIRNLQCFYDAVFYSDYKRINDCKVFRLKSYLDDLYKTNVKYSIYSNKFDCCIIEGGEGKSEYQFYKNFFSEMIASGGKSFVASKLSEIKDKDKCIILIIDLCRIGEEFCRISAEMEGRANTYIMEIYSFEYGLISANVKYISEKVSDKIKNVLQTNISDVIDGKQFEKYFAYELAKIRIGKCGYCRKSGLPKCLG